MSLEGLQTDGVQSQAVDETPGVHEPGDAVREGGHPVADVPAVRRSAGRRLVQSRRRRHLRYRLRAADEQRLRRHRPDHHAQQSAGRQHRRPLRCAAYFVDVINNNNNNNNNNNK